MVTGNGDDVSDAEITLITPYIDRSVYRQAVDYGYQGDEQTFYATLSRMDEIGNSIDDAQEAARKALTSSLTAEEATATANTASSRAEDAAQQAKQATEDAKDATKRVRDTISESIAASADAIAATERAQKAELDAKKAAIAAYAAAKDANDAANNAAGSVEKPDETTRTDMPTITTDEMDTMVNDFNRDSHLFYRVKNVNGAPIGTLEVFLENSAKYIFQKLTTPTRQNADGSMDWGTNKYGQVFTYIRHYNVSMSGTETEVGQWSPWQKVADNWSPMSFGGFISPDSALPSTGRGAYYIATTAGQYVNFPTYNRTTFTDEPLNIPVDGIYIIQYVGDASKWWAISIIGDKTITGENIADGAVTGEKIAEGAITNDKVAYGSLMGSRFKNGSITEKQIYSKTLTAKSIKDGSLTTELLADGSVTADKLSQDVVDAINGASAGEPFIVHGACSEINVMTITETPLAIYSAVEAGNTVILQADNDEAAMLVAHNVYSEQLEFYVFGNGDYLNGGILRGVIDYNDDTKNTGYWQLTLDTVIKMPSGSNISFALWTKNTTLASVKSAQSALANDTAMVYVYMNYDIIPPSLNENTYFDAETSKWLTGNEEPTGINNGDLIIIYKSSAVSTIETIASALGKNVPHAFIVPLGTAKLADGDYPGVDGRFRREDKQRIEDIGWRAEKSLFLRDWDVTDANTESAAGAFIANAGTPNSSKEWMVYNTPKKHFDNGYADFIQIAQMLDDPSDICWRKVSWNETANAFSHGFDGWHKMVDNESILPIRDDYDNIADGMYWSSGGVLLHVVSSPAGNKWQTRINMSFNTAQSNGVKYGNMIEQRTFNSSTNLWSSWDYIIPTTTLASSSHLGLMSALDKQKLDELYAWMQEQKGL